MNRNKEKINRFERSLAMVAAIIVVAGLAYFGWHEYHKYQTSHFNPQPKATGQAGQQGGVTDNNTPAPSTASSSPVASPTPQKTATPGTTITVTSPTSGSKLQNGSAVTGSDPGHDTINYRIVDNTAGQLTSGELNVNSSGKFSGSVENVHPVGTSGYIEFYNVDPQTLKESANTKVTVVF